MKIEIVGYEGESAVSWNIKEGCEKVETVIGTKLKEYTKSCNKEKIVKSVK